MKRSLLNPLMILGTALLIIAIFFGGWIVLNNLLAPYIPYGTRTLYQEAARAETMEQPVAYLGAERCRQCHMSATQEWLHSAHSAVTCENCHGPRSTHVTNGIHIPANTSADLCLTCHAQLASRPDTFPQVNLEEHSGGLACLTCHNPMHPEITTPPQFSHNLPQGTDCLTCHGSQGLRPIPPDHEQRSAESCTQCHKHGE